jgi:hypothetical protein
MNAFYPALPCDEIAFAENIIAPVISATRNNAARREVSSATNPIDFHG